MPEESWDWSIAVPLSQGWKIGDRIFVGGQISADKTGASVYVGDLDAQTHNIFGYMKQILNDAGASFEDMVRLKICFKYDSKDSETGEAFVDRIMEISKEYIAGPPPVITAFAVDLLYPGLDLELDAMAIVDSDTKTLSHTGVGGRYQPSEFSDGICAGNEIYVAGQVALEADNAIIAPGDFAGQAREVFDRLTAVLTGFDATLDDVVKLNLFLVTDADTEVMFNRVCEIWAELCPDGHPAVTPVRVHELARPGLLIQADCVAIR
jgi:enamine deaminase RidA (YjgF/YER057c/UK114 family)